MDITTFMIAVFCRIEDYLAGQHLRKRGPQPTLRDSEVLTIEVVGEFLRLKKREQHFRSFLSILRRLVSWLAQDHSNHIYLASRQPVESQTRNMAGLGTADTA